jgi:hypothetical protein
MPRKSTRRKRQGKPLVKAVPFQGLTPDLIPSLERRAAEIKRNWKKDEVRKRKSGHRKFIESGVKAELTVKQVLWILRNFERKGHVHSNGRIGP